MGGRFLHLPTEEVEDGGGWFFHLPGGGSSIFRPRKSRMGEVSRGRRSSWVRPQADLRTDQGRLGSIRVDYVRIFGEAGWLSWSCPVRFGRFPFCGSTVCSFLLIVSMIIVIEYDHY